MALRHYWTRNDFRIPYGFATPVGVFSTSTASRAQFDDDTALRVICRPRLIVLVGSVAAPPEDWYAKTFIHWCAYVDNVLPASPAEPESGDPRIVASAILRPRMIPSQSVPPTITSPGEYTIFFEGEDQGELSRGQRKGDGLSSPLFVGTAMHILDESGSLPGPGYAGMTVGIWEGISVLWGSTH